MNYRRREAMRFETVTMIHQETGGDPRIGFLTNKYIPPRKSRDFTHVLALELLQLSV